MAERVPQRAMVLAAGLGTRMRPITLTRPKALVEVHGKTLLDHALDALARAGVGTAVVNVHHLADQIERHVASRARPQVVISDERERLLDSGGGAARAAPLLGHEPFFLLNADTFWIDGRSGDNLTRLAAGFDPQASDVALLVCPLAEAVGFDGRGDFTMDGDGRLARRTTDSAPFVYAGAMIASPSIFTDLPGEAFSLNLLWDRAIARGRLHGVVLDGLWLHVGTPRAIAEAEEAIGARAA